MKLLRINSQYALKIKNEIYENLTSIYTYDFSMLKLFSNKNVFQLIKQFNLGNQLDENYAWNAWTMIYTDTCNTVFHQNPKAHTGTWLWTGRGGKQQSPECESGNDWDFVCPDRLSSNLTFTLRTRWSGDYTSVHNGLSNPLRPSHCACFCDNFLSDAGRFPTWILSLEGLDAYFSLWPLCRAERVNNSKWSRTALNVNGNSGSNSQATQSAFNFMLFQHQIRVCFYLCTGRRWGPSSIQFSILGSCRKP